MKFKSFLPFISGILTLSFICIFACGHAYADCDDLEHNSRWKKYYALLQEQINRGQYEQALSSSKKLYSICMEHPMLYLSTGIAVERNGEDARAKKYFYRAAELAAQYPIAKEDAKRIWYKLYEVENPNSIPEIVEEKDTILNTVVDEITAQKEENEKLTNLLITAGATDMLTKYKKLMWVGTGVGASGILLTIIGGIVISVSPKLDPDPPMRYQEIKINGGYIAGYTLLGIGIGLTLSGAGLAGYSGYFLTHADKKQDSSEPSTEEPVAFDFNIGLGSAEFSLTF